VRADATAAAAVAVEQDALAEAHRHDRDLEGAAGIRHGGGDALLVVGEIDRAQHDEMARPLDRLAVEHAREVVLSEGDRGAGIGCTGRIGRGHVGAVARGLAAVAETKGNPISRLRALRRTLRRDRVRVTKDSVLLF
jgi:hypothetical protein